MRRCSILKTMKFIRAIDDYGIFPNRHAAIKLLAEQHNLLLRGCLELEGRVQELEQRLQESGVET